MKLMFSDYLIKPVQRVCKYPLLLEQLRGPVPTEDETDRIITYALRSMKDVALAVDEARRRRDVEIKSKLIVDRLVAGNPSSGSSSHCDTPINAEQHLWKRCGDGAPHSADVAESELVESSAFEGPLLIVRIHSLAEPPQH